MLRENFEIKTRMLQDKDMKSTALIVPHCTHRSTVLKYIKKYIIGLKMAIIIKSESKLNETHTLSG